MSIFKKKGGQISATSIPMTEVTFSRVAWLVSRYNLACTLDICGDQVAILWLTKKSLTPERRRN